MNERNQKPMKLSVTDIFLLLFVLFFKLSNANETMNTTQSVRGNQTLVSSGGTFELGFFSPGSSNNWYIGIWYKNITPQTVVWVANREIPLKNSTSGELRVTQAGVLVVLNETNSVIWSSNSPGRSSPNPVVQLLESGDLVLRDANNDQPENYLWHRFDDPTDTLLPGMDFKSNSILGRGSTMMSWKTNEDPSPGDFVHILDSAGYPQRFTKRGNDIVYRAGPWNGLFFSGNPNVSNDPTFRIRLYSDEEGIFHYRMDSFDSSVITRFTLNPSGVGEHWTWANQRREWVLQLDFPADNCDTYRLCGAYGSCSIGNVPVCQCLNGFLPKDPERWTRAEWTNGCVRRTPLNCSTGDGFVKYSGIRWPDARTSWHNENMTLDECKKECLKNCSCTAYSNLDIRNGGSGCLLWFGDLVDIRVLPADGQDLYMRMASSELGSSQDRESSPERKEVLIVSLTVGGVALLGMSLLLYIWKRKKNDKTRNNGKQYETNNKDLELPLFDMSTILKATDNFSMKNKIGEGGYGPVYKGTLEEGQEVAVKRLSNTSRQGLDEFMNEVVCIAKHQHRNLVKLLGYCIQGEEKMLIYEYLPNKSLDLFLFNESKRASLDWAKRFHIINGIARGLMYLHQDSQLRIIHRDLKASNILLDSEMNSKISDFGLAKRFRGNETEDQTSRVVGTYGYMSPEYAVRGEFSVKSDVFSFGVLLLEIVSGKRNSSYSYGDRQLTLLGHAWTLYKEGMSIKLVDTFLKDSDSLIEVLRVFHVGLLCAQQFPDDRPTMSSVVSMLSNEFVLRQPNPPGFFTESDKFVLQSSSVSFSYVGSTNEVTSTTSQGRYSNMGTKEARV